MRTTVDIEKGLLKRLRDEAQEQGLTFKDYFNRVLRQGLEALRRGASESYECPAFSMGSPAGGVDLDHALGLVGDLEDTGSVRDFE